MRVPLIFSLYITKQFVSYIALSFFTLTSIISLFNLLEIFRRSHGKNIPFIKLMEINLLKIPYLSENMLPFAILFGTSFAYSKLNRNYELIVARASGISVWQFILPSILATFIIGIFFSTIYNHFSAFALEKYTYREAKYLRLKDNSNIMSLSNYEIWLKDSVDQNKTNIIRAASLYDRGKFLSEVTIFLAGEKNDFSSRIYADLGLIDNNNIVLYDAILYESGKLSKHYDEYKVPTHLVSEQLQNSIQSPDTISFWKLPEFIKRIDAAGFSSLPHLLYYYSLIINPFFLCALVLIATSFSLTIPRSGNNAIMMLLCSISGFLIYFFDKIVIMLGLSGNINILIASLFPTIIILLLGISLLLHLEDG